MIVTTAPDVKPFLNTGNNIDNNVFRVGDYVYVQEDYSRGYNRPVGCGFVENVNENYMNVRYTPAHDNGRCHTKIPTSKVIPIILHQDMMVGGESRNRLEEGGYS